MFAYGGHGDWGEMKAGNYENTEEHLEGEWKKQRWQMSLSMTNNITQILLAAIGNKREIKRKIHSPFMH